MSHTFPTRPRLANTTSSGAATSHPSRRGRGRGTTSSSSSSPSRGRMDANNGRPSNLTTRGTNTRGGRSSSSFNQEANTSGFRSGAARSTSTDTGPSLEQRGQYAGGFTVFAPNEQRRQKINEMAARETKAYESFKQANRNKTYNYVGTVGGGDVTQNQVRNRQAHEVRAQKFNRQMKQAENREERRRAEQEEIQSRRAQARQRSEDNRIRADRTAPADEVRRKREAFLQQLEAQQQSQ